MSEWCIARARPGAILVAPSAAARRRAIRAFLDREPVAIGVATVSRGRLLSALELRAGFGPGPGLPAEVERMLAREAGAAAGVPLFEGSGATARAPAGAVRALITLRQHLRLNRCTADDYLRAGGDERAAAAVRIMEQRREDLKLQDEAQRLRRLIDAGVPALDLVVDEPHFPNLLAAELFEALVRASTSCAVGVSALQPGTDGNGSAAEDTPLFSTLRRLGFVRETAAESDVRTSVSIRVLGGAGVLDEVEYVAREMLARLRRGAGGGGGGGGGGGTTGAPSAAGESGNGTESDSGADHTYRGRSGVRDTIGSGTGRVHLSPQDLLGVAPTAQYRDLLHEACVRVGVPVASPRRVPVQDVPLVRALLETFRLLSDAELDTPERGLALLATPYPGLGVGPGAVLARRLVLGGLGSLRSWQQHAEGVRRQSFRRLAADVPQLEARIQSGSVASDFATVITTCALDHGFLSNGRRYHLRTGRDESVRLDQLGWDALTTAFERLDAAFALVGVRQVGARRWLQELEDLLAGETVRVEPRAREGVHISVAGAGLPPAAHVYAVGWREGLVPRRTREAPLLPDRVKRALNDSGARFELMADRAGAELERRERVVRAARQSLTLSWPAVDADGDAQLPSFYIEDLGAPNAELRAIGDPTWPLRLAATRAEQLTRATTRARHHVESALGEEAADVRSVLRSLSTTEHRRWSGAMHAGRRVELAPEVLAEVAPAASSMSPTQARVLLQCQFRHFGERRLGVRTLEAPRLDAPGLGTIAHAVLAAAGRAGWSDEAVLEELDAQWRAQKAPVRADNAARFELDRLGEALLDLALAERQRLEDGLAQARWFELAFGLRSGEHDADSLPDGLSLPLPPGAAIPGTLIRGSIDRVDMLEVNGVRYGVAVDYKLGSGRSYGDAMYRFEDFQLPIYSELMWKFGLVPAGVYYLGLHDGVRHGVVDAELADGFVRADDRMVKRLDRASYDGFVAERMDALTPAIVSLAAGEIAVEPRNGDCGYCDLRPVCRVGTFATAFAGADRGAGSDD